MAGEWLERNPLLFARLGIMAGFAILVIVNVLWLLYITILIFSRGNTGQIWDLYSTLQWMVLTLDVLAGALLALGFWQFGTHHEAIQTQAIGVGIGFGIWALVTFLWRIKLLWTHVNEINPVSRRMSGGEFDLFIPQFEFFRENYTGFFVSSFLLFVLMYMLVSLIKNYMVYESYKDVNLNLFKAYGLLSLVGAIIMGLGWMSFNPGTSGTTTGDILFGMFVLGMSLMFVLLPLLGIWVFQTAFVIHRSALETLKFILRRRAERV
jgi:hypothetical protein